MATPIIYKIDGNKFSDYDVTVEASHGVIDGLKMKEPLSVDWEDYNGRAVDLSAPRYEERVIKLDCWMKADSMIDFAVKVNNFLALFDKAGLHRLEIVIDTSKPLVYQVYRSDAVEIDKRWNDSLTIGRFTLTLVEPLPVKKVLKYTRTSDADKQISITFESDYVVNIFWGDGNVSSNIAEGTTTHDYADDGTYYVVVGGNINDITSFTTTGTVVWSRL